MCPDRDLLDLPLSVVDEVFLLVLPELVNPSKGIVSGEHALWEVRDDVFKGEASLRSQPQLHAEAFFRSRSQYPFKIGPWFLRAKVWNVGHHEGVVSGEQFRRASSANCIRPKNRGGRVPAVAAEQVL